MTMLSLIIFYSSTLFRTINFPHPLDMFVIPKEEQCDNKNLMLKTNF